MLRAQSVLEYFFHDWTGKRLEAVKFALYSNFKTLSFALRLFAKLKKVGFALT